MVSDCNLLDVALSGYPFTWGSGRLASNLVEENLVAPISDHNPIVLNTSPKFAAQRCKPFRFENKWLEEADVGECWNGFRDFELLLRLKAGGMFWVIGVAILLRLGQITKRNLKRKFAYCNRLVIWLHWIGSLKLKRNLLPC